MHSRRPGARFNRGRIVTAVGTSAPPPAIPDPLDIFGASALVSWLRSDLGITTATGVQDWADQSGNGQGVTQATPASQPVYNATDARFNGRPSLTFDGVDDSLANTTAAISVLPVTIIMVMLAETWTSADAFFASNSVSAALSVRQAVGTPQFLMISNVSANANTRPLLSAMRLQAEFTGSVADRLLVGASSVTGASAGTTTGTGFRIGRQGGASTANSNISVAEMLVLNVTPSAGQNTQLDAYFTDLYTASVVT